MKKPHLTLLAAALVLVGAGTFLYFRFNQTGFDWTRFTAALAGVRWTWLTLGVLLILASYLARAIRWGVMIRPLAEHFSLWRLTVATCVGFTAVVIFGRAGELVRPYLISRSEGVSFSSQIAVWLVERILDLLMMLLLFGIALTQVESSGIQPGPKLGLVLEAGGWAAGVAGLGCLAVIVALRLFQGGVGQRLSDALAFLPEERRHRVNRFLSAFDQGMEATRRRPALVALLVYSAAEWILVAGAFQAVFRAFPETAGLSTTDVMIVLGFVVFGSVIQVPGLGGGMQVATVVVLTEFYRLSLEGASGVALVLWAVNFLIVVPLGLGMAFHEGLKWRSMRHVGDNTGNLPL